MPPRVYPCRVPGCMSASTYFAMCNVARYGHVCAECWLSFTEAERGLYAFQPVKNQVQNRPEPCGSILNSNARCQLPKGHDGMHFLADGQIERHDDTVETK